MGNDLVWLDGDFCAYRTLDLGTHALHYATSVFEGIRSYKGTIFRLDDHIDRLINSANYMMIPSPFGKEVIKSACNELLCRFGGTGNCYIRPIIFKNSGTLHLAAKNKISLAILISELGSDIDKKYRLTISERRKIPSSSLSANCKASCAYALAHIEKVSAELKGYDDAIMFDENDYVAEATTSNIFFVKNAQLFTPPIDNVLNGITRQSIIEIAKKHNIICNEKFFKITELLSADEVFLTGTAIEVACVSSINDTYFSDYRISQFLQREYFNLALKHVLI